MNSNRSFGMELTGRFAGKMSTHPHTRPAPYRHQHNDSQWYSPEYQWFVEVFRETLQHGICYLRCARQGSGK